jgi:phosphomannomutase
MKIECFKAYDVRGVVPDALNEDIAQRIGRAFAEVLKAQRVVIGHDIRLTSPVLSGAIADGLMASGVEVWDIGLCGTEEVYFATAHLEADGGLMVTASHNPIDYNGIKFVGLNARPLSSDTEMPAIQALAERGEFLHSGAAGQYKQIQTRPDYIQHLLGYIDQQALRPLKIAMDAGNGGAGLVVNTLKKHLPFDLTEVNFAPDGRFPNGIPNPLLPERRHACAQAVRDAGADLGVAWDGDFDRCFFFDEQGEFIEGYYLVGLLAEAFLAKQPGERIVYDTRLTWNTIDLVGQSGGTAIQSQTGHAFIKASMRRENAIYGGEMSAHHYFRDFFYCDSGMIPWLLVAELLSKHDQPLSALVADRQRRFPCSGEINFEVADTRLALDNVRKLYEESALQIDDMDGLSMEFVDWRFNLRASNTEPVTRLNVESRGDAALMQHKTEEISRLLCA